MKPTDQYVQGEPEYVNVNRVATESIMLSEVALRSNHPGSGIFGLDRPNSGRLFLCARWNQLGQLFDIALRRRINNAFGNPHARGFHQLDRFAPGFSSDPQF